MPFLIDGHNLIPKVGLRLDSIDDELDLVGILQEFSRRSRKGIEVYFDGAPAGSTGSRRFGRVTAHFVSERATADAAIEHRLIALKAEARNWTVVSSDKRVLSAARSVHAGTETSEEFARELRADLGNKQQPHAVDAQRQGGGLSEVELNHWLDVFKKR
jgi:predicted RNA-binding protein with PIN domain